ncbi:hypothetical protein RFI_13452 [Reticulomyxa filosa]|uniref:Uncharacterized protein n=1 Tax=Reticulomyxa filosa TaxID=46433 RepID=X6NEE8_RETFI|nr:hypothetical protein RFI_13452 [Reticulomyxa filosa]|eukprot:ETO23722.1 hypothetical protein RFI_13452 [Reticulomyxa filosa]
MPVEKVIETEKISGTGKKTRTEPESETGTKAARINWPSYVKEGQSIRVLAPICATEFRGRVQQMNGSDIIVKPLDGPLLGREGFDTVRLHSAAFIVGIDWQYSQHPTLQSSPYVPIHSIPSVTSDTLHVNPIFETPKKIESNAQGSSAIDAGKTTVIKQEPNNTFSSFKRSLKNMEKEETEMRREVGENVQTKIEMDALISSKKKRRRHTTGGSQINSDQKNQRNDSQRRKSALLATRKLNAKEETHYHRYNSFTSKENDALLAGLAKYKTLHKMSGKGMYHYMKLDPVFGPILHYKTNVQLKDRVRVLRKNNDSRLLALFPEWKTIS